MEPNTNALVPKEGWSWGGMMFNAAFLIGAKRYQLLWWCLLAIVPIVNVIFWIVFVIYLGVRGHKIAAEGTQFANQSEYDGYVKGQDHAGKVFFFVFVVVAVIGLCFAIASLAIPTLFLGWHPHPVMQ